MLLTAAQQTQSEKNRSLDGNEGFTANNSQFFSPRSVPVTDR